jgi:hypothetical protein
MSDDRAIRHSTQRARLQELEAENVRHLADLTQMRQERDTFRNEAAKLRKDLVKLTKEMAALRNKYDLLSSTHEDVKRDHVAVQEAAKPIKKVPARKRKAEVRTVVVWMGLRWLDITQAANLVDPDAMLVDDVPEEQRVRTVKFSPSVCAHFLQVKATTRKKTGISVNPSAQKKRTKLTTQETTDQTTPLDLTRMMFMGTILPPGTQYIQQWSISLFKNSLRIIDLPSR